MLESKEIEQALPHRPPFLMVDGILDIVPNQSVVGYKEVREDEPWFKGHFPGEPLFPGVLIIETMAQIGGFCFWTNNSSRGSLKAYLIGVEKVKFLHPVVPGDRIVVRGKVLAKINYLAQVECVAYVNEHVISKAIISYRFR